MGMIGNYMAIDDLLLNQIIECEKEILDIDLNQCPTLNIDKTWQAIHYLLCKTVHDGKPPAGYVVPMIVDNSIDCELDFGAFYITSRQVKEASDFLNSLNDDDLKKMYDFKSMLKDEVYPLVENDEETEFYEYIYFYLAELRKYFKQTAEKKYAVIFYVI